MSQTRRASARLTGASLDGWTLGWTKDGLPAPDRLDGHLRGRTEEFRFFSFWVLKHS